MKTSERLRQMREDRAKQVVLTIAKDRLRRWDAILEQLDAQGVDSAVAKTGKVSVARRPQPPE